MCARRMRACPRACFLLLPPDKPAGCRLHPRRRTAPLAALRPGPKLCKSISITKSLYLHKNFHKREGFYAGKLKCPCFYKGALQDAKTGKRLPFSKGKAASRLVCSGLFACGMHQSMSLTLFKMVTIEAAFCAAPASSNVDALSSMEAADALSSPSSSAALSSRADMAA